ncbi:DNA helicase [Cycloclasticus sp. 44_32_T64]|nr:DNA helicase [Cycloclasticus sp. 44_32_T64]
MIFSDLFSALKKGTVVITVNQRLARHLLTKIEQAYIKDAAVTWPSPSIISFDSWLLQLWQQRFDHLDEVDNQSIINKTLLSPEQALVLWEQVIRESQDAELLNVVATAKAASTARQLAIQWQIDERPSSQFNSSMDLSAFEAWHKAYQEKLIRGNWIDRVQLVEAVTILIDQSCLPYPQQMVLAGFDVLTPSQQALLSLLKANGCELSEYTPYEISNKTQLVAAVDTKEEMLMMAQWARERLDESPDSSIGIVVPELQAVRQQLETTFNTVFYPSVSYAIDVPFNKPYNVSLGRPLSHYAPIQQISRWLQFFNRPLPLNELIILLRSPFLSAGEAEWGERAQLELNLRKNGYLTCSIHQLNKVLQATEAEESRCRLLQLSIHEVIQLLDKKPNRVLPSEWVELIRLLLAAAGVQGDKELNSTEYQVFQAWDNVLHTFASLDAVYKLIDYDTAINAIRRLVAERVFQPETPPAPIQIMGLMEASGHTFDALWVCGLHDKCWPAASQPSPFLPLAEQRKQGLVQSSATLQHDYAANITRNWAKSANSVIFSYSSFDAETPRQMSPLLEPYDVVDKNSLLKEIPLDRLGQRITGESISLLEDGNGPLLNNEGVTHGGVGVLKEQSACPFKAFAHYRLLANSMEEPEPGIDARLRGTLVHRALEVLWGKLKTHRALCLLADEEKHSLLETVTTQIIEHESQYTPILKTAFGRLEARRISELLEDWLAIDIEREPFEVIEKEFRNVLTVGPLKLNTIIDRVDILDDGSTAIIDYKTGSTTITSWFGERPEEPQLPLYSVFGSGSVHSISFAQLKKGNAKYVGISDGSDQFSCLKSIAEAKADEQDWAAQMSHWRGVISSLADEFVAGDARVNPTKKACDYCDLTSLCRINEKQPIAVDAHE